MVKNLPSNAGGAGLIPGWGAKMPPAWWSKNRKQKQYCNKFNKDFKKKWALTLCVTLGAVK